MSPYAMALSPGFISFVRKATGLTQKEFADSIGVSQSIIDSYETGNRRMSEGTWSKIKTAHREVLDKLDVPDMIVNELELYITPDHIKRIRKLCGLSLKEFAESIGVCKSTIGNAETGRNNVSDDLRMRVKERFPIQYRHVMFGEDAAQQNGVGEDAALQNEVSENQAQQNGAGEDSTLQNGTMNAVSFIIQSPTGADITPEEIMSGVSEAAGGGVDSIYVRVDHNAAYWVKGEENGKVELW